MNAIGSIAHGRALTTTHTTARASATIAATRRLVSTPHAANTRMPGTVRQLPPVTAGVDPALAAGAGLGPAVGGMPGILERPAGAGLWPESTVRSGHARWRPDRPPGVRRGRRSSIARRSRRPVRPARPPVG